jgi:hypothetical protein
MGLSCSCQLNGVTGDHPHKLKQINNVMLLNPESVMLNTERVMLNLVQHLFRAGLFQHLFRAGLLQHLV